MSLGALLFDVDGTLADTEPQGHLPAYNRAFEDLGLGWRWSPKLYRKLLRVPGGRERIHHYLDEYDPDLSGHGKAIHSDRQQWVEALHKRKTHYFRERLENGQIPLRMGVARLIREAGEANLRIAIVTNASTDTLSLFLKYGVSNTLRPYINLSLCGDDVEHKKPAPDLYRTACEQLECAPEYCVAIEDSATGMNAAYAAGVPSLVTVNEDTRQQRFNKAEAVVDSLGEPGMRVKVLKSPGFSFEYVELNVLRRISAQSGQERGVV